MVERGSPGKWRGLLVLGLLAGCPAGLPESEKPQSGVQGANALDYSIRGRIDWGRAPRSGQVLVSDMAKGASVNLIDAGTGNTKCATIATPAGEFVLSNCGLPEPGLVYILEAQKGLGGQGLGADSVRLRTFIRHDGGQWRGMHASGGITISPSTTALAIMQSGYSKTGKTDGTEIAGTYIGIIQATGTPYDTVGAPIDTPTYRTVTDMVRQALDNDSDAVHAVTYSGSAFSITLGNLPSVTEVKPATTFAGNTITIIGRNLANPTAVTIGGKPCAIQSSTPTSVVVSLPFDATTGPLVVSFGTGTPTPPVTYPVEPPLSGRYKPAN